MGGQEPVVAQKSSLNANMTKNNNINNPKA
jgi:hypothetical protein